MMQQINLYQAIFHPQKNPLSAGRLLALVGAVSIILIGTYALLSYQVSGLDEQLAEAREGQVKLVAVLADLQGKLAPKEKSELLEQEVGRLAAERDAQQPLVKFLAAIKTGKTKGISSYMEALARSGVEGLWLRRIGLGGDGRRLVIEGSATDPELVPRYLRRLAREGSLSGLEFDKFEITRSVGTQNVDFRMETHYFEGEHEGS